MQPFIQGFRNLPFKTYIYWACGISLFTILLIVALRSYLPPEVPLFYGKPVGEGQLTTPVGLMIAPGVSLAILALNLFLAIFLADDFLKKVLIISGLFVSLLSAITVIKIILLVNLI